jgi:hypothetical protein
VADCGVVRYDLIDGVGLCEGAGAQDGQQTCDEHDGGFHLRSPEIGGDVQGIT